MHAANQMYYFERRLEISYIFNIDNRHLEINQVITTVTKWVQPEATQGEMQIFFLKYYIIQLLGLYREHLNVLRIFTARFQCRPEDGFHVFLLPAIYILFAVEFGHGYTHAQ